MRARVRRKLAEGGVERHRGGEAERAEAQQTHPAAGFVDAGEPQDQIQRQPGQHDGGHHRQHAVEGRQRDVAPRETRRRAPALGRRHRPAHDHAPEPIFLDGRQVTHTAAARPLANTR